MIYRLRRKFILISGISIFLALFVISSVLFVLSRVQLNRTMDTLTDAIAANDGVFPEFDRSGGPPPSQGFSAYGDVITEETQFSTRFFTVWLGEDGEIERVNVDAIFSVSEEQAQEYAQEALKKGRQRGWVEECRYKVFETGSGTALVFVNGAMNRTLENRFLLSSLGTLGGSGLIILILFIVLSKWVVRPAAESDQKQKQFITDASHELKTPLTLILSNLDIVEAELGENEWLEDIRSEGQRMGLLVNQMVALARMDEDQSNLILARFNLSEALLDTVSEFSPLAGERGMALALEVKPEVFYTGDEGLIRRLISILLDNAVKYCDPGGQIRVTLTQRRHPVITVENTYREVGSVELERLFDRFYRGDKARTYDGGFGVGLSIAKAIAKNHRGELSAYQRDQIIGFKAELK